MVSISGNIIENVLLFFAFYAFLILIVKEPTPPIRMAKICNADNTKC